MAPFQPKPSRAERSHARILDVAARVLRERGAVATGVDAVMNGAGLTRGGFYMHFRDKTELVSEALEAAFAQVRAKHFSDPALRGRAWLERLTAGYLSLEHVDRPGDGCAVSTLGAEIWRAEPAVREVFTRNVGEIIDLMTARLAASRGRARERAIVTFALGVGAVTMARAVTDRKLAREILETCRRHLLGGDR